MKYFKLTYYLLFLCIVATSCSTDDSIIPDQTGEEVRVQLTIQFPEAVTRATPAGTDDERNISNVHLYVFEDNGSSYIFKEEANVATISNADGSGSRTITGILSEGYYNKIKLVALANLNNKGLDFGRLPGKGVDLSSFYQTLIYTRTNDTNQWPLNGDKQLPMWGECSMNAPKAGFNSGSLSLTRAVAKVEVMVNSGSALANEPHFKMTKIEVCQYNNRGFCTTGTSSESPNIPSGAVVVDTPLEYQLSESEAYLFQSRLYIPEQININVNDNRKLFLKLTTKINEAGKTKVFTIPFKKNGTGADFNILRNNVYVFNITNVKIEKEEPVEITLSYTVEPWEYINIPVTPFGN